MNNNTRAVRSSSQKQSHKSSAIGTRHSSIATPNNNIHININLNVKKKSHCYHPQTIQGKKINNFIEVSDLKPQMNPIDEMPHYLHQSAKTTALGKHKFLLNKPDTLKNLQKAKKKKNKQKEKEKTSSKPFTPQKHLKPQSQQKSIEKSRTHKKLLKKKQSRSMENIKIFKQKPIHLQQNKKINNLTNTQKDKNKFKSRSNSSSKQRSKEKSGQKLKKMRSSSKNVVSFQNSGIKKILGSQKQSGTKNDAVQNMRRSKKSLKVNKIAQKDMIKINEFMQQKKRKDQKKKRQKQGQQSSKDIKIKDEIMKLSKKEFYTKQEKKSIAHSVSEYKKKSKFPMFYGQEEENNEDEDDNRMYGNFGKNARHQHRTPEKTRPFSKHMSPEVNRKSSGKKNRLCLIEKYLNGEITKPQKKLMKEKVIVIQAFWRGYWVRKNLMQEIAKMNKVTSQKKKLIHEKKSEFWDDDENNSIINLEIYEKNLDKHEKHQRKHENKHKQSDHKNSYKTPENSNYNSSQTPTEQNHTNHKKYESQSGIENEFLQSQNYEKLQNINEFKKNVQKLEQKHKQQTKNDLKPQQIQNNSLLSDQIEILKRQIEEQNRKFLQLEMENTQLRHNLKSIVVEKDKDKQQVLKVDLQKDRQNIQIYSHSNSNSQPFSPIDIDDDSVMIYELNRANFGHGVSVEARQDSRKQVTHKFRSLKIQTESEMSEQKGNSTHNEYSSAQSPSNLYVQNLKKQFESYESPSNRQLKSAQLSNLKGLKKAFKKKELSIEATYEKNALMYQQMLQNNIVSPRTYSFKKVQLEEKYNKQKQEITQKYQQAQKVIKYISEEIVEQQKVGQDQSPQKGTKQQEDERIEGLRKNDFEHVSEKIDVSLMVEAKGQQWKKGHMKEELHKQIDSYNGEEQEISNGNESGQSNFRKYWTEDMQEVHKKVLEISNKIDQALQADSKYSQSLRSDDNKQYSSQTSNFNSLKSNGSSDEVYKVNWVMNRKQPMGNGKQPMGDEKRQMDEMRSPIFQEAEYKIEQVQQKGMVQKTQQNEQVMGNSSNVSSTSSGRNLEAYNIHYPSSPKSQKQQVRHNFEVRNQNYEQGQNYIENNNSQLSQNRSSLSENSMRSSSKPKQMRGFDTRLTFIKQYCIALCEFIRSEQQLKEKFISNISTPLRYDYFQMLKSYRTTVNNQNDTRYNSTLEDYIYPYFREIKGSLVERGLNDENTLRFEELYEQNYNVGSQLTVEMIEIRKFFVRAIIDVFNQSLDFQRPGSIYGEPLPWLVQSRNLKNNHVKFLNQPQQQGRHKIVNNLSYEEQDQNEQTQEDQRLDKIFGVAIAKIIQWGSCLCGFIPEPVSFDGEDAQAVNIDDEQTNLVRETRLAYMLQKSLAQDEEKMVDNTMEQLEVQLEVQQMVIYDLVSEFAQELLAISRKL